MTESEWLACADPTPMLAFLGESPSARKLQLLGCAACRRIWNVMHDERCRLAVETAEQFVDGHVSERVLDSASGAAEEVFEVAVWEDVETAATAHAASYASSPSLRASVLLEALEAAATVGVAGVANERAAQASLLRDVFGNPFRPVSLNPAWLTPTVVSLAAGIYAERAFDRLPILADALQDAGCENADLLGHCRAGRLTHVRGCWAVDLVLGRE